MLTTEAKPKRRWGRGFFRLWIVVSALWIIAVVAIAFDGFPTERSPWLMLSSDGQQFSASELREAADRAIPQAASRLRVRADELEAEVASAQWAYVRSTAAFAAAVPAVLLVIGLAVAWVARGFRSR